ncbi:MAG: hypothetical protein WAK93_10785 [Solirubrobacteraceae bacterium]
MGAQRLVVAAGALATVLAGMGCASGHASVSATSSRPAAAAAGPQTPSSGIPARLSAQARPIGRGARFHPGPTGPIVGRCRSPLGARFGVHIEVFAANRVVLVAAGIGAESPLSHDEGRISGARCFGALATLEPTGVVLVRPGARLTVADLFRSWGQPLSGRRLAGFEAPGDGRVQVFVGGRRRRGQPGAIPLTRHAEIVLEVGPHVPPHSSYQFPPGS